MNQPSTRQDRARNEVKENAEAGKYTCILHGSNEKANGAHTYVFSYQGVHADVTEEGDTLRPRPVLPWRLVFPGGGQHTEHGSGRVGHTGRHQHIPNSWCHGPTSNYVNGSQPRTTP